jgi:hypothetical protein
MKLDGLVGRGPLWSPALPIPETHIGNLWQIVKIVWAGTFMVARVPLCPYLYATCETNETNETNETSETSETNETNSKQSSFQKTYQRKAALVVARKKA